MKFLLHALTWWHDSTLGTALFTSRKGEAVGKDDQGNKYYRERGGDRRWVIYNGEIDATRIPPEWHAWLHGLSALPPSEQPLPVKTWEKPHQPNLTGTDAAYHPPGSLATAGHRARATGDYEPWTPV
jgi:NADH:ubiquinone oxidoreductase subunit